MPEIREFSTHVTESLGYYVYLLVDPTRIGDPSKPWTPDSVFYVGKGTGNRVYAHLLEARDGRESDSAKLSAIRRIFAHDLLPRIVIAAHGLSEDEAFRMEAVLIRLLGRERLASDGGAGAPLLNEVEGQHWGDTMLLEEDVRLLYAPTTLSDDDIRERVIYVSLNGGSEATYLEIRHNGEELKRRTLGSWLIDRRRARRTQLVAGVYAQVVRVVFAVTGADGTAPFVTEPDGKGKPRVRFAEGTMLPDHPLVKSTVTAADGSVLTKFYQGACRYGRRAWQED